MVIQRALDVASTVLFLGMVIEDLIERKINIKIMIAFISISFVTALLYRPYHIYSSIVPGLLLMLISYFSKERIGYGDGLVCMGLGLSYGIFDLIIVISIAFFISSVWITINMMVDRIRKKTIEMEIAFLPFLLIGIIARKFYG